MNSAAESCIRALARKDEAGIESSLAPKIRFRGLTPNEGWEAHSPSELGEILFAAWYEPKDEIVGVVSSEVHDVSDRVSFRYLFRVRNPDGDFIVEQQGYATLDEDGRIGDISIVCSGFVAEKP